MTTNEKSVDSQSPTNKKFFWIDRGESVNLNGTTAWGQSLWWWLTALMFTTLLAEIAICAWPAWKARTTAPVK